MKKLIFFLPVFIFQFSAGYLWADAEQVKPLYVCNLPNINDYDIFANGGWDGNWYLGYNVCWIVKLQIPAELSRNDFSRCFIGTKIGRAKTKQVEGRPSWDKEPIPGSIYMGISSTSAWKASQRYFLISTPDIPLEVDSENALEGTGEARWFWTEVQIDQVNFSGPNFAAIWSPSEYFLSRDTSPVLAGGWKAKDSETTTWLNDEIQGSPPIDASTSLKTPISVFEPAVALKLIPNNSEQKITINIDAIIDGKKNSGEKIIMASIFGSNIEKAWMEVSMADNKGFQKVGRYVYDTPYYFTLKPRYLLEGKVQIRIVCQDNMGNTATSAPVDMQVQLTK